MGKTLALLFIVLLHNIDAEASILGWCERILSGTRGKTQESSSTVKPPELSPELVVEVHDASAAIENGYRTFTEPGTLLATKASHNSKRGEYLAMVAERAGNTEKSHVYRMYFSLKNHTLAEVLLHFAEVITFARQKEANERAQRRGKKPRTLKPSQFEDNFDVFSLDGEVKSRRLRSGEKHLIPSALASHVSSPNEVGMLYFHLGRAEVENSRHLINGLTSFQSLFVESTPN